MSHSSDQDPFPGSQSCGGQCILGVVRTGRWVRGVAGLTVLPGRIDTD
jgi:hypothetical protein